MEQLKCVKCGAAFPSRPGKGRQPERCPDCRIAAAAKPLREGSCVDCGAVVRAAGANGSVPKRCQACKAAFYKRNRQTTERPTFTCAGCGAEVKPTKATGVPPQRCEPCRKAHRRVAAMERQQQWKAANPERAKQHQRTHVEKRKQLDPVAYAAYRRDGILRRNYGLTREDFDAMVLQQDGLCAICRNEHVGSGGSFHVDHNHTTGAVRGLLCGNCNTALGLFGDDVVRLEQAIAYLRLHGET